MRLFDELVMYLDVLCWVKCRKVWILFSCVKNAFLVGLFMMSEFLDDYWGEFMMNLSLFFIDLDGINIDSNGFVIDFRDWKRLV